VQASTRREAAYDTDRLDAPSRVFVDLKSTRTPEALRDAVVPVDSGVLQRIRVGRQSGATRVVLDLRSATRTSVYPLYNPYRVVIDLEAPPGVTSTDPTAGPLAPPSSAQPPTLVGAPKSAPVDTATAPVPDRPREPRAPAPVPRRRATPATLRALSQPPVVPVKGGSGVVTTGPLTLQVTDADGAAARAGDDSSESATPANLAESAAPPAAASRTARGDYSLSRQLGLGIARIVIDAGHGGHDPGAKVRGLSEAAFVLDIARRLGRLLASQPGVEVIHTRDTDRFVPLEERTDLANRVGADLFISIHANASASPKARGVETYVLNFAANPSAEAVAARENAGSSRLMRQLPDIVKAIALNNKLDESRELARFVQEALYTELRKRDTTLRDLGVKQAPFLVLVGATMPAILTEVAFLTSQTDGPALRTEKYRQDVAEAILRGITKYQQSLKKVPAVATQ
jgi:N-acetylmuramoyl-L-alanine amidase